MNIIGALNNTSMALLHRGSWLKECDFWAPPQTYKISLRNRAWNSVFQSAPQLTFLHHILGDCCCPPLGQGLETLRCPNTREFAAT